MKGEISSLENLYLLRCDDTKVDQWQMMMSKENRRNSADEKVTNKRRYLDTALHYYNRRPDPSK
jgi:hypothetical protein